MSPPLVCVLCVYVHAHVCKGVHVGKGVPKQEQAEWGRQKPDGQVKAGWVDTEYGRCPLPQVYPEPWR